MPTNDDVVDENAPTDRQLKLKSVEQDVRRRGDGKLVMELDAIAALPDRRAALEGIKGLIGKLND
ncbi:hypothetical protein [Cupriavidus sp. TMH.W2]|uniref:hypothetical protein n=1 Tax=Cupriavidus sp. TMH.W2 TaxID=3434465 RepID=UPI003D786ABE